MPFKIGGGDHLQYYDESDGRYDEASIAKINEEDKRCLVLVHYFGLNGKNLVFHWPVCGLHDKEYCDLFTKFSRNYVKNREIDDKKALYLLSLDKDKDKSEFLKKLGYRPYEPEKLLDDIDQNTEIRSLTFSRYENNCFKCVAKTNLRGSLVTSIWELRRDFSIRFITLIPGGDKRWK